MFSNLFLVLGLLQTPDPSLLKVRCGIFDRCGWHRVDTITHPIGAAVTHVVNQAGQLVDRSDQGVNNWWEHVKHDWGPSINRGAIHLAVTIIDSTNNFLTHPCPSGTDRPYTDRNGYTIHKCDGAYGQSLPSPTAANQGISGEIDGAPIPIITTTDGAKIFPKYCSKISFEQTIEIYDVNRQVWIQRVKLPPDGCVIFGVSPDASNYGAVVMRFYYQNGNELLVQYLHDGEEFTL